MTIEQNRSPDRIPQINNLSISPKRSTLKFWKELEEKALVPISSNTLDKESCIDKKTQCGEVIVLVGNSTTGKTSIINELIKHKQGMIPDGIDFAWTKVPLNYLNKFHTTDMTFLKNVIKPTKDDIENPSYILNYIDPPGGRKPELNFKEGVPSSDKKKCQQTIERLSKALYRALPGENSEEYANSIVTRMMDDVILEAKQGRSVALDILQVHEIALKKLLNKLPDVKLALVYIPFQKLAERVIRRNNEALKDDLENARPGVFPLEQFTKLFRPRNNTDLDSDIVQSLTFREAQQAVDSLTENSINFLKSQGLELESIVHRQGEMIRSRNIIFERLGFKDGDDPNKVVELTPSYRGYHMLINTAQTNKQTAEAVKEAVNQILLKS
jgi:hypothetical protein